MLGWFKKKFSKKPEGTVPEVQEPQAAPPTTPELPPAPVSQADTVGTASEPAPAAVVETPAETAAGTVVAEIPSPSPAPAASAPVDQPQPMTAPVVAPVAAETVEPDRVMPQVEERTVQKTSGPEQEAADGGNAPVESPAAAELSLAAEELPSHPEAEPVAIPVKDELTEQEPAPEDHAKASAVPSQAAADADIEVAPEVEAVLEPQPAEAIDEQQEAEALASATAKTQEKPKSKSLFQRLQERLGKTRDALVYRLDRLFLGKKEIDQDLFEQLEEILIMADLGVATTLELIDVARKKVKRDQLRDPQALKEIIREQILAYIEASEQPAELVLPEEGPFVIMVVGVNGVGKTTTIGKLAAKFVRSGQSVLLVAGDTFRAAAINQLTIWAERVGVEIVAQKPGADPSSVVFDGLTRGMAHGHDVIIIDTAGRLHTSVNLMEELKKIKRVVGKKLAGAPHEILLVLDATTGQNGISQAKLFHEAVGVTGLALTKLDGTAKGGIVANICRETKIPVRFIGIGEQIDDLRDFEAKEFVEALFTSQQQ